MLFGFITTSDSFHICSHMIYWLKKVKKLQSEIVLISVKNKKTRQKINGLDITMNE